jgi:hypothetical protein
MLGAGGCKTKAPDHLDLPELHGGSFVGGL